jgi:hypothetical protein
MQRLKALMPGFFHPSGDITVREEEIEANQKYFK